MATTTKPSSTKPPETITRSPPPPSGPKGPARKRVLPSLGPAPTETIAQSPAPAAPPPSKWRELSSDLEERAKQRLTVSGEAAGIIEMLDGVARGLPPGTPLRDWERKAIQPPLEETLFKYGVNMDPLFSLALALGSIAFIRWQEYRQIQAKAQKE